MSSHLPFIQPTTAPCWRAVADDGYGGAWHGRWLDLLGAARQAARWRDRDAGAYRSFAVEAEDGRVLRACAVAVVLLDDRGVPVSVERFACCGSCHLNHAALEEIADARIEIRDRATNAIWRAG